VGYFAGVRVFVAGLAVLHFGREFSGCWEVGPAA
jgi:hypothetical protein